MHIVVLAGGYSPERDVSLSSGSLIANALIRRGHAVLLLDAYEGLRRLPRSIESLFRRTPDYSHSISESAPNLQALKERVGNGSALVGANVGELCRAADAVFLALHGAMGENGQMQAYLDCLGVRYTGSRYDGCMLSMDKDVAKRLLLDVGVSTPSWIYYDTERDSLSEILQKNSYPCVVKPVTGGSSVGVSMAKDESELREAIAEASRWESKLLLERQITGRELSMGILDGQTLPPVEIIPKEGFYDYKNKYQGDTEEICPAPIDPQVLSEMERLTKLGFSALRLSGYARFDYLLDGDGRLWCLEANSLPGMTPSSLLPQEAAAVGISYDELCERILSLAFKKK